MLLKLALPPTPSENLNSESERDGKLMGGDTHNAADITSNDCGVGEVG